MSTTGVADRYCSHCRTFTSHRILVRRRLWQCVGCNTTVSKAEGRTTTVKPNVNAKFKYTVIVTLEVEEGTDKEVMTAVHRRLNHGYQYGDGVSVADIHVRRAKVLLYDGNDTDQPPEETD